MQTTAMLLSRVNRDLTGITPPNWSTDTLNRKHELLVKLHGHLEGFAGEEQRILASRVLSDEGKRADLRKLATNFLPKVEWLGRVVATLDTDYEGVKARLFTVKSPVTDPVERYQRALEVRSVLYDADDKERSAAFLKAAREDQVEALAAMLDGPLGPMVDEKTREDKLLERAQRIMPDVHANFEQHALLREVMRSVRDHAALWLRGYELDPAAIHRTLGGTVESTLGTPDGQRASRSPRNAALVWFLGRRQPGGAGPSSWLEAAAWPT